MTVILNRPSSPAGDALDGPREWGSEVVAVLAALRAGWPVILRYDDESGEQTGDLLLSAEHADPAMMAFFLQRTSGFICVAVGAQRAQDLGLPASPADDDGQGSAFACSAMVDEASLNTSGPSAVGRSRTALALADPATGPHQLVLSGHTPVMTARRGGVLEHAGRAEAAVDLVELAGLASAGVLSAILSDDALGMARRIELDDLASRYGMVSIEITDVVDYRRRLEGVVRRSAEARIPTEFGDFRCVAYETTAGDVSHVALVWGDVSEVGPVHVGFHTESLAQDVLGHRAGGGREGFYATMRAIARHRAGVLVYLRSDDVLGGLCLAFPQDPDAATKDAAAQILVDLGVHEVSLLPGAQDYLDVIAAYGFTVAADASVEEVP